MGFFQDLGDSLTGKGSQNFSMQELDKQLGFNKAILDEQQKEAELKYSPALQAQKSKMYITIAIIAGIVILIVIRKLL